MEWELGMCEICDGAKSTSEMPCSKVLTEFGKILYQVVGDGPAFSNGYANHWWFTFTI